MPDSISASCAFDSYKESALLWYMGAPDGKFASELGDVVSNAKKIYVTINSLLGTDTAEEDRFYEGKKQVPELVTKMGLNKIYELLVYIYKLRDKDDIKLPTLTRLARQSEMKEGTAISTALRSATKLTVEECMSLGYGDKNGLAICEYELAPGSVHFDYERLGDKYAKAEEREVLIAPGNVLETVFCGYSDKYTGRDGKPAALYKVKVSRWDDWDISKVSFFNREIKAISDDSYIALVQKYYQALNDGIGTEDPPTPPMGFYAWKNALREQLINELQLSID